MRTITLRFAIALALPAVAAATTFASARDYGSIDKVNSGITIEANSTADSLETVNGGVHVGANSKVGSVESVNGGIHLEDGVQATSVDTVNGGVTLGAKAIVRNDVETVNGGITLEDDADVGGKLSNVNGGVQRARAHVAGGIETVQGDIRIGSGARVEGGILVEKPNNGWISWGKPQRPPRVVIEAGAVVEGDLRFEHEVELYVHESAKVGRIEGAEAKRFAGDPPK
ncbi:MAG TPA: hypothetical protein VFL14_09735, partial [Xanthomonadales bacterium]|nr:hypothetical protein [Xanthomonadales bacterium]